mmetsp:Transcript_52508/g.93714  ORF Transcript_52508/g.93714 Transcript_52508/m.93714 type:complete len:401 (-) Transcript_52508:220-1422(-)
MERTNQKIGEGLKAGLLLTTGVVLLVCASTISTPQQIETVLFSTSSLKPTLHVAPSLDLGSFSDVTSIPTTRIVHAAGVAPVVADGASPQQRLSQPPKLAQLPTPIPLTAPWALATLLGGLATLIGILSLRTALLHRSPQPRVALAATSGHRTSPIDRRTALLSGVGMALSLRQPAPALAADELVDVYFGVGCFWHVQHEFVEAERRILGRKDDELTAYAGYAGGTKLGRSPTRPGSAENLVCYHNFQQIADYGRLGHGEAVGMKIPASKVEDFAAEYFKLFDRGGDRPDKGDRGGEYRSMIGLPGGVSSPLFPAIERQANGLVELKAGMGDDGDTLGRKLVWVYDTADFPFHIGEVYHQYHDGFMPGENYPDSYNNLKKGAFKDGRLPWSGCPDIVGEA